MKSIIQEASSIAKAIEQAWIAAGSPAEFTIKVLEEPQRNFLGFTTRSAKIALFFDISSSMLAKNVGTPVLSKAKAPSVVKHDSSKAAADEPLEPKESTQHPKQPARTSHKVLWNEATLAYVTEWLTQTLTLMGLGHITFTLEPSDFYLRVLFYEPLLAEQAQEKRLFASFATILMESLKKQFKAGFRGHKIVLLHAKQHDVQQG